MASKVDKPNLTNNHRNKTDLIRVSTAELDAIQDDDEDQIDDCGLEPYDDEEDTLFAELDDDDYEDDEELILVDSSADELVFARKAANKDNQDKNPKNKKDNKNKDIPKNEPKPTLPTVSSKPVSTNITYAPKIEPVEGTFSLVAIGIRWKDHKGPKGSVSGMANSVAKTYSRLSGGKLKFKATGKTVDVGLAFSKHNLNRAEKIAKAAVGKHDIYAIISGMGRPHAGTNIAHLHGTLLRDALHEIGHILPDSENKARKLPSKLGHSGLMIFEKGGKTHLDGTGDRNSFMGRFASTTIAGPQFYYEGWLDVMQVAAHDPSKTMVYKLQPVASETDDPGYLKGVLIPRTTGRDQFLSVAPVQGKQILNFYYTTGGGSQKIGTFNEKPYTYEDIIIEAIERDGNNLTVEIRPNPEFNGVFDDEIIIDKTDEFEGDDLADGEELDTGAEIDELDDGDEVAVKAKHRPRNK